MLAAHPLVIKNPKLAPALAQLLALRENTKLQTITKESHTSPGFDRNTEQYLITCYEKIEGKNVASSLHFTIPYHGGSLPDQSKNTIISASKILRGELFSEFLKLGKLQIKTSEITQWVKDTFPQVQGQAKNLWEQLCQHMRNMFKVAQLAESEG